MPGRKGIAKVTVAQIGLLLDRRFRPNTRMVKYSQIESPKSCNANIILILVFVPSLENFPFKRLFCAFKTWSKSEVPFSCWVGFPGLLLLLLCQRKRENEMTPMKKTKHVSMR